MLVLLLVQVLIMIACGWSFRLSGSRWISGRNRCLSCRSVVNDRSVVVDQHPVPWKIDHRTNLFFIGSCFSENIHNMLVDRKFCSYSNPQGILYNPISIQNCLEAVEKQSDIAEEDIILDKPSQVYSIWGFHGDFSSMDKSELIKNALSERQRALERLRKADVVFITLGSARVHTLRSSPTRIVANCHKQPADRFIPRMLTFSEVKESLHQSLHCLRRINPAVKVVFTISPVRHIKDTLPVNSWSKGLLLSAVHEVIHAEQSERLTQSQAAHTIIDKKTKKASIYDTLSYFPSYEIVLDELRDYRYFNKDLVHPSPVAVQQVFRRFLDKYCTPETLTLLDQTEAIQRDLAHRPRHAASPAYRKHLQRVLQQIQQLESSFQDRYSKSGQRDDDRSWSWAIEKAEVEASLRQLEEMFVCPK